MFIMNNKEEIRKKSIEIRKNITNTDIKSNIIFEKIINLDIYKKSKVIGIYNSLSSEVNTNKIIEYSFNNGKIVVLPKIVNNDIKFYKIEKDKKYIKSKFGVLEPIGIEDKYILKDNIPLMIIPGVSFDKNKNRMGFGKGYYDKYLENSNTYKIGICFQEQICEKLIVNSNDIKMDIVITNEKLYM